MASLLIKDLPESVHRGLKESAKRHRRSMTQEAIAILEHALQTQALPLSEPYRGKFPLKDSWLRRAVREGRA